MTSGPFGGGSQEFLGESAKTDAGKPIVYMVHAGTKDRRDSSVDVIRNTIREEFDFSVVGTEQLEMEKGYRSKLFDTIEECVCVVVVLEKVTPELSFEYGISVSMQKPLIALRSQRTRLDYHEEPGEETEDSGFEEGKHPPLRYVANLPGLTEDQVIVYKTDDPADIKFKLVREMALHREAIATEIHRAGHELPLNMYLQFLKYLRGKDRKRILEEAMDLFPNEKSLFIMAGRIKLTENDLIGAAADFERAVELNPEDPTAYMEKGGAYYDLGQFEVAARDWEEAINLKPINPHAHYNRGNAVFFLDLEDEASRSYFTAIEQKPDFVNALNNQASIQINRGNFKKAAALLEEAIHFQPSYAYSYFNLARANYGMSRPSHEIVTNLMKAARHAKSNLMMGHDIKRNTYCLFLVYAALGNRDEALVYLRKCSNYDLPLKSWRIADRITCEALKSDPEFQALIATAR